jgi:IS5 family transposase
MLGKPTLGQNQLSLFANNLIQIINLNHPLVLLAKIIPWQEIEKQFTPRYSKVGNPSHPIRKMVGLLLLQHLYKLSDERVVAEWEQNVYYQFFTGEAALQWGQPCAASDLVHFRKRIGKEGINYLFISF